MFGRWRRSSEEAAAYSESGGATLLKSRILLLEWRFITYCREKEGRGGVGRARDVYRSRCVEVVRAGKFWVGRARRANPARTRAPSRIGDRLPPAIAADSDTYPLSESVIGRSHGLVRRPPRWAFLSGVLRFRSCSGQDLGRMLMHGDSRRGS